MSAQASPQELLASCLRLCGEDFAPGLERILREDRLSAEERAVLARVAGQANQMGQTGQIGQGASRP
jgi:hypothetical protein